MRHGSLFSGIGGFDLASEWMGWENVFQVEWDSFCQKILTKNFPNVERHGDIKEFDGTKYRGLIDIISGGFPCQPFSVSGKRRGTEDNRYLWPEMLRVIKEIQPRYIVAENVHGLLTQQGGVVFETVYSQMENEGYEIQSVVLPACSLGAQHRRDRIWIIGHLSNSSSFRLSEPNRIQEGQQSTGRRSSLCFVDPLYRNDSREYISNESRISGTIDGVSDRVDRVKGLGNAIVPQVAYEIFKAIEFVNNSFPE